MDALKRAERAREAKERSNGSATAPAPVREGDAIPELSVEESGVRGLSLEPLPAAAPARPEAPATTPRADGPEQGAGGEGASTGIDLFRVADGDGDRGGLSLELNAEELAAEARRPPPPPPEDSSPSLDLDLNLQPLFIGGSLPHVEDTSATLPSLKAVQASVNAYFDGSESVSVSMDAVQPDDAPQEGAATTITGKRLGEEVEARRTAQRVFDARAPRAPGGGGLTRVLVFVVLPLLLVAGGGLGVWYLVESASSPSVVQRGGSTSFSDMLVELISPGPAVVPGPRAGSVSPGGVNARGSASELATGSLRDASADGVPVTAGEPSDAELVRRARATLAAGTAALQDAGAASLGPDGEVLEAADLSVRPPAPRIVEAPPPGAQTAQASPAASAADGADPVRATERPAQPAASDRAATVRASSARAAASREAPPPPQPGTLNIARGQRQGQTAARLRQAYDAYQRGDLAAADAAYQPVLREQPNNRDALLGAAAVAANAGRPQQAAALYQRLLRLNPRDSVARAALYALQPPADALSNESELRDLLASEPQAAHLHYSLGNLYAAEGRWPEAQAAYFQAVRFDPSSPDYAFNLAVSLDHMGQRAAALDHYRQAMLLAGSREAGFELAAVQTRIAAMRGQ